MNDVQIFSKEEFGQLRTVVVGDEVLFVGLDVAKMLEYAYPSKAVIDHCKGITKLVIPSEGGEQQTNCITLGDVLRLIVKAADQSKNPNIKEKASKIERWIFDEVVPTVLHHGAYMTPKKIEEILSDPDTIIQLATNLKAEQEKRKSLEVETAQQKQIIGELKPKADYTDYILKNKSLVTITQIAKDYGMSGQAMNKLLHELGVQYKLNDQWLLYAKYHNKGYTQSNTYPIERKDGTVETKMQTEWTQKGRLFLYNLLKTQGLLPVIERDDRKGHDQNASDKKEEAPICR